MIIDEWFWKGYNSFNEGTPKEIINDDDSVNPYQRFSWKQGWDRAKEKSSLIIESN